jgi:hypothetical protein
MQTIRICNFLADLVFSVEFERGSWGVSQANPQAKSSWGV